MEEAEIRALWDGRFAARLEQLRRENKGSAMKLAALLVLGLGVPVAAAIGAVSLAAENPWDLEPERLWSAVGLLAAVAILSAWLSWARLAPGVFAADARLRADFFREFYEPAVSALRPGWRCRPESTLSEDALFAASLFERIRLTGFERTASITGSTAGLTLVMHEVRAVGHRRGGFMHVVLRGYFAEIALPRCVPGRVRFCRKTDSPWRRPPAEGFERVASALDAHYDVEKASGGPGPHDLPGLADALATLAERGTNVHVAIAGSQAWVALDSDRHFVPLVRRHSAEDLIAIDRLFRTFELVASCLPGARGG